MNDFPKMKQAKDSLECGAFNIVACLYALELIPIKTQLKLNKYNNTENNFSGNEVIINIGDDLEILKNKIYSITGILSEENPQQYINSSGLNSIAAMAYVIIIFGLKVEVLVKDQSTIEELKIEYPSEFLIIDKLEVPVTILPNSQIELHKCLLISAIVYPDDIRHYVSCNDKGRWFDPGVGENNLKWDPITEWSSSLNKSNNADWLGISLRVFKHRS